MGWEETRREEFNETHLAFRVRGFKQTNEAYNYILIEVETFYFSIAKMILHVQGCARYGGTE